MKSKSIFTLSLVGLLAACGAKAPQWSSEAKGVFESFLEGRNFKAFDIPFEYDASVYQDTWVVHLKSKKAIASPELTNTVVENMRKAYPNLETYKVNEGTEYEFEEYSTFIDETLEVGINVFEQQQYEYISIQFCYYTSEWTTKYFAKANLDVANFVPYSFAGSQFQWTTIGYANLTKTGLSLAVKNSSQADVDQFIAKILEAGFVNASPDFYVKDDYCITTWFSGSSDNYAIVNYLPMLTA